MRAAAFLLDWAIVLMLSAFFGSGLDEVGAYVLFLGGLAAYHIGFVAGFGATPGKMAMRLQVTDLEGKRLTPDRAILRYLILFVSILPAGLGLAFSTLLALSDERKRTLHDRVAQSLVIRAIPQEQ